MSDATIVRELPLLTWRGLAAPPYDALPVKWRNRLAPRQYPHVDGDGHDPTGRDSFPFSARLYFVNTVVPAYAHLGRLFPEYWERWRDELFDGAAGPLDHPVLGRIQARVAEGGGVLESKVQSGLVVDVSWVETNEDPSVLQFVGEIPANAAALAKAANTAAAAFGVKVAPGRLPVMFEVTYGMTFPAGFVAPGLDDIFGAIRAPVFVADLSALDMLLALMGDVAAMVLALQDLDDVAAWPAVDTCIAFWRSLHTMHANFARAARKIGSVVLDRRTTLDGFAHRVGNTVAEIMALNAAALRGPYADRGATLHYYLPS